ncbi:unnamed protein product, partial [Amoebophrya sp. A25]
RNASSFRKGPTNRYRPRPRTLNLFIKKVDCTTMSMILSSPQQIKKMKVLVVV